MSAPPAPAPGDLPHTARFLTDEIQSGMLMTAAQVCVISNGCRIGEFSTGHAGSAVTDETIFRIYCAGKPFAAIALATLVDQGGVNLGEPLRKYLPDYQVTEAPITLRHVLSHGAGLHRPSAFQMELMDPEQRETFLQQLRIPPGWRPGVDVRYGDFFGWHLLGKVIERVTGQDLRTSLRAMLLDPLGLHSTWIGMTEADYHEHQDRIGLNYDLRGPRAFPVLFERSERVCTEVNCAYGIYTTATDLARFYSSLLAQLRGARHPALPGPEVLEQFCLRVASSVEDGVRKDVHEFGLGFMVNLRERFFGALSPSSFGHDGWMGSSFGLCDPEQDLVVAAVLNGVVDAAVGRLRLPALLDAVHADQRETAHDSPGRIQSHA